MWEPCLQIAQVCRRRVPCQDDYTARSATGATTAPLAVRARLAAEDWVRSLRLGARAAALVTSGRILLERTDDRFASVRPASRPMPRSWRWRMTATAGSELALPTHFRHSSTTKTGHSMRPSDASNCAHS